MSRHVVETPVSLNIWRCCVAQCGRNASFSKHAVWVETPVSLNIWRCIAPCGRNASFSEHLEVVSRPVVETPVSLNI